MHKYIHKKKNSPSQKQQCSKLELLNSFIYLKLLLAVISILIKASASPHNTCFREKVKWQVEFWYILPRKLTCWDTSSIPWHQIKNLTTLSSRAIRKLLINTIFNHTVSYILYLVHSEA